jgi:hypothetical protein
MLLSFLHNEQEMDESFRLARLRLRAASSLLPTRPAMAGLCLIFRFRCSGRYRVPPCEPLEPPLVDPVPGEVGLV